MQKEKKTYDVIIIGSGLGGLTAGALLAHAGKEVLVLEQHYTIGGCAHSFRRGEYYFDVAIHLVGGCEKGGEVYSIYERLGLLDQIEFMEINPMYRLLLGEYDYEIPANLDQLAKQLGTWFPEDERAIRETITEIKRFGEMILKNDFQKDPQLMKRFMEVGRMSFAKYLEGRFAHPHTSLILSSLHPYVGTPINRMSSLFMMVTMMSYHGGAFYPRGGSQKMGQVLKEYIESKGGRVKTRSRVEKIIYDGNTVQGVIDHKGNTYHATKIVSNADIRTTLFDLLGEESLPKPYKHALERMIPSFSAVILYGVVKEDEIHHRNFPHELFILPDKVLDTNDKYLYDPMNPETDPFFLICCPSTIEPALSPEGHSVISLMSFCDPVHIERIRAEKGKSFIHENYLSLIEKKLPGITDKFIQQEFATPKTIEKFTMNTNGSIFGWMKSNDQIWPSNIGPQTPFNGLYLAGHWTQMTHGAFGAMRSGRMTADYILNMVKG
jgi:phytoene dehydrogenase-like protein